VKAAATWIAAALLAGVAVAGQEPSALPWIFAADVEAVESGSPVRVEITITAWTDDEARATLAEALQASGTRGLLAEMLKLEAGRLQVLGGPAYVLRIASTWESDRGRHVRIASADPLLLEQGGTSDDPGDYPFGFAELVLPKKGRGEGSLLAAGRVRFDDEGRLVAQPAPGTAGACRLTSVRLLEGKRGRRAHGATTR